MKVLFIDGVESAFIADDFLIEGDNYVGVSGGQRTVYPATAFGDAVVEIKDYTPPAPIPEPPVPELRYITKLAFRNRFTMKEKVAIELAGSYNPADPVQKQQMAAAVRVSNADIAASTYIDLDRPDTRAGVKSMEDFGLLAAGRAGEILDNPVQDFERYKG
jgi:hypothetical protein